MSQVRNYFIISRNSPYGMKYNFPSKQEVMRYINEWCCERILDAQNYVANTESEFAQMFELRRHVTNGVFTYKGVIYWFYRHDTMITIPTDYVYAPVDATTTLENFIYKFLTHYRIGYKVYGTK